MLILCLTTARIRPGPGSSLWPEPFARPCVEKRTLIWGEWVKENVLKDVAHRQWVFTIPKVLRKLFYKYRLLLAELARCAAATILELYGAIFPDNHFRPGIIASTQTFGDLLIWHLSACRTGRSAHSLFGHGRRV
ncbi:MAG: hypothetical protein L6428_13090 [Candidatus Aminicenantes bacterium]|nr:hypothetical protein [Candidatus Aminicenantes bacterium]